MDNYFNKIPNWNALARLGKSPILRLTVLAPFIGWLILFNQQIVELLAVSKEIIFGTTANPNNFTISRLHIVYFGLLALGTASFIFAIACPPLIKEFESENDFIAKRRPLLSDAMRAGMVTNISNKYVETHPKDSSPKHLQSARFPSSLEFHFHDTLEEMFARANLRNHQSLPFISALANIMYDELVDLLANRQRVARGIWQSFHGVAKNVELDLLTITYCIENNDKPFWRLAITTLYFVGFCLLAAPTIETTLRILRII